MHANEAFLLTEPGIRRAYMERYRSTAGLYYMGQPDFEEVMARIRGFLHLL